MRKGCLLRIVRPFTGRKWVVPFPDQCPAFRVEISIQDPEEVASIADYYKVGGKNALLKNEVLAGVAVVKQTILGWEGEEPIFGEKLPVNDENKRRFLLVYVEDAPGERVTLFSRVVKVAEDQEAVELKNS